MRHKPIYNLWIIYILTALNVVFLFISFLGKPHWITPYFICGYFILLLLLCIEYRRISLFLKCSDLFITFFTQIGLLSPASAKQDLPMETEECLSKISYLLNVIEETNTQYDTQLLLKKAEFDTLQSQINPHFLYNTLDAIRGQALKDGTPTVSSMVEALSSLFRYSISSNDTFRTFEEELSNLDHYLLIQQFRFNNRFQIIKEIEDETILHCIKIPKLLLQPIVENAIYHGLEMKSGEGIIRIKAYHTDKAIMIIIHDNGIGIDLETLKRINEALRDGVSDFSARTNHGTGMALININKRIQLYYGSDYGLTVYSTVGLGTEVHISLPLEPQQTKSGVTSHEKRDYLR